MDIKKLCAEVIDKLKKAEDGHLKTSAKNRQIKRIAEWTMKQLDGLDVSTKSSYLSRIRKSVNNHGFVGIDMSQEMISKHCESYPEIKEWLLLLVSNPAKYISWKSQVKQTLRQFEKSRQIDLIKVIDNLKAQHQIINMLVLDVVETSVLEQKSIAALKEKKCNISKISKAEMLALIKKLAASNKTNELMLCVALATGRRMIEIIRISKSFDINTKINTNTREILFHGQAKKREDTESYLIPVIGIEVEVLVTVLQRIALETRKHEGIDNYALNALYASKLGYTARKYGLTEFKQSRAIYARLALESYKQSGLQNVDDDEYVKQLLGHEDYAAGLHYKNIIVESN